MVAEFPGAGKEEREKKNVHEDIVYTPRNTRERSITHSLQI